MNKIKIVVILIILLLSLYGIYYAAIKYFRNYEAKNLSIIYLKTKMKDIGVKKINEYKSDIILLKDTVFLSSITETYDSKTLNLKMGSYSFSNNPYFNVVEIPKTKSNIRVVKLGTDIKKKKLNKSLSFWDPEKYYYGITEYSEMYPKTFLDNHDTVINYFIEGIVSDSIVDEKSRLYALNGKILIDVDNDLKSDFYIESQNKNSYMIVGFVKIEDHNYFICYLDEKPLKKVNQLYKRINFK